MSSLVVLPLANYPTGTQTTAAISIPDTVTSFTFSVQRCTSADTTIWPNAATTLNLTVDLSLDGGTTWQSFFTFGAPGGIITDKHGTEIAASSATVDLPAGTGRKGRITVTIANGPLRTSGTMTVN